MKLKRGSTSVRRLIFVADSSSTVGAGLANLAHNTASLVAYYFAGDLSNEVQITLASATLGTFTSGGFVAVDNTNMPGWYEIGIPDAALDGGNECAIQLRGATNMVPVNIYIELDSFDYQTATQPVNVTQFGGTNGTFTTGIPDVKVVSIASNTVNASALATDAVSEIQSGLATSTNVTDAQTAIITQIDANETKIDAVKAKTDNLPSDPADQSIIIAATDAILTAVNTRLATSAYTSPPSVSSIADAVWDEARTGHTTSGTFGFYVDAQVSGISGGGGGDATLAKQEEILEAIDTYFTQVIASVNGTQDTIVGFPASLTIGDSYTEDGGNAIHVFIRDENDDPITSVGGHDFTDADFECDLTITNSGNTGRVRATVTYVDPGVAESYLKVEIPPSESRRAAQGSATMQCVLKWDGVAKTIATQTVTWVARI